jgi:hypothetical protein
MQTPPAPGRINTKEEFLANAEAGSFHNFFPELGTVTGDERPLTFIAPELPEETLLEREHNEILAKLNFVVALCECVCEVARTRAGPLGAPLGGIEQPSSAATRRRAEQVILLVRALQWLSSGLSLATQQLKAGRLQPTVNVKEGAPATPNSSFFFFFIYKNFNPLPPIFRPILYVLSAQSSMTSALPIRPQFSLFTDIEE